MDYEKLYKETLNRAKTFYKRWNSIEATNSELVLKEVKDIFPELCESEDEKIRKELINFFSKGAECDSLTNGIKDRNIIAWLEKQGEKVIDCTQNHQDINHPNGGIVLEDFNGGEGFYKLNLDYLNKNQVEEIEELVRMWNTESNSSNNENIRACIGMCLTDVDEQRFKDHNTNLKECIAWLDKQYETENENDTDFTIYYPLRNGNGKYECIPYSFYGSLTSFSKDEDLIDFLRNCFYTKKECEEWIEKQDEQNTANFNEAEKEKNDFVSGQFIECRKSFNEFKEFESYWLEYVGDDTYIGRSDNILNQRLHITPQQLFTLFTHQHCPRDNEKQGEQKPNYCHHEVDLSGCSEEYRKAYYDGWNNCNQQHAQLEAEQKPTDKAEPKFKVGDWIVGDELTCKVVDIRGRFYKFYFQGGETVNCDIPYVDEKYRLWTIEDVKDGDVLEFGDHGRLVVGIVSYVNKTTGKVDVNCLLENNNFKVGIYYNLDTIKPHPATKEQRDLLFQKMKEAGYEWNNEKKELKQIDQKPAWSEEDEQYLLVCKNALVKYQTTDKWDARIISHWLEEKLKSLKSGVQPQPKQEWDAQDEAFLGDAIYAAKNTCSEKCGQEELIDWLKSLKPNHWKPTEEQLKALRNLLSGNFSMDNSKTYQSIESLYNDLKEL